MLLDPAAQLEDAGSDAETGGTSEPFLRPSPRKDDFTIMRTGSEGGLGFEDEVWSRYFDNFSLILWKGSLNLLIVGRKRRRNHERSKEMVNK